MSWDHDHERAMEELGVCTVCALAAKATEQATLPDPLPGFDGATFDPAADQDRLGAQMRRVLTAVADSNWHTLAELATATGDPEASVSARLRDLRKPQFGGYTVEHRRGDGGEWSYRLQLPRT